QKEISFCYAAIWAYPIIWNVIERGACGDPVFGHAHRFVVYQAARAAHPLRHQAAWLCGWLASVVAVLPLRDALASSMLWISLRRCFSAGVTMATNTASRKRRW